MTPQVEPSKKMPVERYQQEVRDGSVYGYTAKTRCRVCGVETKEGHPAMVCLFALAKRVAYLEAKLEKLEGGR